MSKSSRRGTTGVTLPYFRLPLLAIVALSLALWLEHFPSAQAKGTARGRKPNAEGTTEQAAAKTPGANELNLATIASTNPYEKMQSLLAVDAEKISWKDVKAAMVELNISIPPVSSALSSKMWDLSGAPAADKRISWVKSTDWVVNVNRYIAQAHSDGDSMFIKVNRALRSGTKLSADEQKFMDSLNDSLVKLPALTGYSFRGVTLPEDAVKAKYVVGKLVKEEAFTSASINPSTAYNFAFPKEQGFFKSKLEALPKGNVRVIYIINGKKARGVSFFSEYWAEAETLFTAGSEFTVKAVSPKFEDDSQFIVLEEK